MYLNNQEADLTERIPVCPQTGHSYVAYVCIVMDSLIESLEMLHKFLTVPNSTQ